MTFRPKQRVRSLRLIGPTFEPDWSELVTIERPTRECLPLPGPDWYIVRFSDGGRLCAHASRLMPTND